MKKQHIHQEVLVLTRTTLAKKVLLEINDSNKNGSPVENLRRLAGMDYSMKCFLNLCHTTQVNTKRFLFGEYIPANLIYLLIWQMLPAQLKPCFPQILICSYLK